MLSGMSRISFRIVPQLSRRSVSFLSSFAERGRATRAHVTRNEINRLNTNHLVRVFWARAIIECPQARRNLKTWNGQDAELVLQFKKPASREEVPSTILLQNELGEGKMRMHKILSRYEAMPPTNPVWPFGIRP